MLPVVLLVMIPDFFLVGNDARIFIRIPDLYMVMIPDLFLVMIPVKFGSAI